MPTTYSKFRLYDQENGAYVTPEIPNIIDVVELTGVSTSHTSNANEITVASTAGLFPGMSLHIATLPQGAFIHAVKSSTVIVAHAPAFDTATGTWTVSAANANATATASSMTGSARGANAIGIPMVDANGSTYRNEFGHTGAAWNAHGEYTSSGPTTNKAVDPVAAQPGVVLTPDSVSVLPIGAGTTAQTAVKLSATAITPKISDSVKGTPPRPMPLWTTWWLLVASTGAVTLLRKSPQVQLVRTGSSTAS